MPELRTIIDKSNEDVSFYSEVKPVSQEEGEVATGRSFHYTFEVGKFKEAAIYADFTYRLHEDNEVSIYSDDIDLGYLSQDADKKGTMFNLSSDIIEKCSHYVEKQTNEIRCNELHEVLYDEYVENCKDGFEIKDEEDMYEYDEWLTTAYTDEGYFLGHVAPEDAKFLCENDGLLDLDYYDLYEESVKGCFTFTADDIEDDFKVESDSKGKFITFNVNDAGIFHEDIDKLIARSHNPDLLKTMCRECGSKAETFPDLFLEDGDISDYIGFEIKLSGKEYEATAFIDISTRNAVHSLGQIPLSAKEQAFVLRACDAKYKENTGKSLLDLVESKETTKKEI